MDVKNLKEKAKERYQRVKDWCWEHRALIGFYSGISAVAVGSVIVDKIWGPKSGAYEIQKAEDGSMRLNVLGISRSGKDFRVPRR